MTVHDSNGIGRRSLLKGAAAAGGMAVVTGPMLSRVALGQTRGGTLRAALLGFGVVNTLDPQKAGLNSDFFVLNTMFNTLVKFDGNMKIVPDLAESWTNPNPTTYEFKLRKGVKFHDGNEMTSDDVKFTIERAAAEATKSPNRAKFTVIDKIDTPDKYTVRFVTKTPFVPLLSFFTNTTTGAQIISRKALEKMGDEAFAKAPVGTGAFKFKEWKPGEKISFVAHKEYFEQGLPYLDAVDIPLIPEEPSGITAILGGQIDLASTAPFADVPKLEKDPNITISKTPGLNFRFIQLNIQKPPFDDVHFRRALSLATNREAIVAAALFGEGTPMWGATPPAIAWAFEKKPRELCVFNPERAKAELAKSKYKAGTEAQVITWGSSWWKRWTEIFVAQVNQVLGVKFTLDVTEANTAFSRFRANDMQAQATGWIARVEADEYVPEVFRTDGPRNFNKYSNPEVDKLVDASRQEFDQTKRGELLKKAEDLVVEDMPMIFTMNNNAHNMWSKKVKGFVPLPSQSYGNQFPPVSLG